LKIQLSKMGLTSSQLSALLAGGRAVHPPVQPDSGPPSLPICAKDSVRHPQGAFRPVDGTFRLAGVGQYDAAKQASRL